MINRKVELSQETKIQHPISLEVKGATRHVEWSMANGENLYREFGPWLKERLGMKVQKISINAGFTCPNRDGRLGTGGCTYCNNQTFNPAYCETSKSITEQLEEGKRFFARKYPDMKYLAYFQAYTNTYAPIDEVVAKYEEALRMEDVVGLVIGTRPDCMPEELLDYLSDVNKSRFVLVEYGIECADDDVLRHINRGHTFGQTREAVCRTKGKGITTGGHVILGLPGTDCENPDREAEAISSLPLDVLKIHQLQLIKGTVMADEYTRNPEAFHLFTVDEYIDYVIDYIERLRPDIIVERFVSQSPASLLAVKGWGLKNHEFVDRLRQRMTARGARQGRLYKN